MTQEEGIKKCRTLKHRPNEGERFGIGKSTCKENTQWGKKTRRNWWEKEGGMRRGSVDDPALLR